jgi:hypothetical protein
MSRTRFSTRAATREAPLKPGASIGYRFSFPVHVSWSQPSRA